jgi:uncharacterized small protein (DUF1192 family)
MVDEEDLPKPRRREIGGNLETLSLGDHEAYIAQREAEIAPVGAGGDAKPVIKGDAEALFRR